MKVLHLSTNDIHGGAARATYRIHQHLRATDVDSRMLVREKRSTDPWVIRETHSLTKLGPTLDSLPLRFYAKRDGAQFSPQWASDVVSAKIKKLNPDIVHLHWICDGYLRVETLARLDKPLVWTLHDMWPFTGGCHYAPPTCDRFKHSCGACPRLQSAKERDLSRQIWNRKAKAWQNLDLTVVVPSLWFADCARESSLFRSLRIETIPHGLNTEVYSPTERAIARQILRLPQDKRLVLFGASAGVTDDPRKGFQFLQPALQNLSRSDWRDRIEVIIFGTSSPQQSIDVGFPVRYLGQLHDDVSLALVYSSADVMIVPSMQESFGQTASESLACGTPVVAFNATGLKDIIDHQQNGYLANPYSIEDLAAGIVWILENEARHKKLRDAARLKAEQAFSPELQAYRYLSLYKDILGENNASPL